MVKPQPWTSKEETWACSGIWLAGSHRSVRRGCGISVIGDKQNLAGQGPEWPAVTEPLIYAEWREAPARACGTLTTCWSAALTCSMPSFLSYPQALLLSPRPLLPLQSLREGLPHFLWKIMHCHYLTEFWHSLPNSTAFAGPVKAGLNEKTLDIAPPLFFFIFAIPLTIHYSFRVHV